MVVPLFLLYKVHLLLRGQLSTGPGKADHVKPTGFYFKSPSGPERPSGKGVLTSQLLEAGALLSGSRGCLRTPLLGLGLVFSFGEHGLLALRERV